MGINLLRNHHQHKQIGATYLTRSVQKLLCQVRTILVKLMTSLGTFPSVANTLLIGSIKTVLPTRIRHTCMHLFCYDPLDFLQPKIHFVHRILSYRELAGEYPEYTETGLYFQRRLGTTTQIETSGMQNTIGRKIINQNTCKMY